MKKKLLTILLVGVLVLGMATGCTEQNVSDSNNKEVEEKSKGKCEVEECINLLEPTMKVEKVNEIIGFEGEKKEGADTYIWQLTKNTKIEVEYKDGLGTIRATYDKDKINNDKLKLSICYEILGDINKNKTYTYEEMVEKLEGIEGYLESNSSSSKMYKWVKDGQTFRATFNNKTGKCSIASIR